MKEVLQTLLPYLGGGAVCYLAHQLLKYLTVKAICDHPRLSDSKVKSITKMISKDKNNKTSLD